PVISNPMVRLQLKLKRLKSAHKIWNKTVFGNIDTNIKLATDEVVRLQILIDQSGLTEELQQLDYKAQLILTNALLNQDQFWLEKARVQHFM
ncbi:endonuclease/exonuclease/phosphatase family protein, partial [Trifolium medium]|nr:endonuclease/exonuclease/phosphatase family protein [Trifolium medium]